MGLRWLLNAASYEESLTNLKKSVGEVNVKLQQCSYGTIFTRAGVPFPSGEDAGAVIIESYGMFSGERESR